jgi:hypothetical protein
MGLVQHEGGPCGVLATIQVIPLISNYAVFSAVASIFNQFLHYVLYRINQGLVFSLFLSCAMGRRGVRMS